MLTKVGIQVLGGTEISSCSSEQVLKTYELLTSGIFHLISSDRGWLRVTETAESKAKGKWVLLYTYTQIHIQPLQPPTLYHRSPLLRGAFPLTTVITLSFPRNLCSHYILVLQYIQPLSLVTLLRHHLSPPCSSTSGCVKCYALP